MYPNYLPRYNQRKGINSSFTIDVNGCCAGLIDFTANIDVEMVEAYSGSNLKLHVVVTESQIHKTWQGMSELNFVERKMIPNHLGTNLDFSGGNTQSFSFDFSLDPSWNAEHCELVVFVQNNSTKEILQGTKINLLDFENENDYDVIAKTITHLPVNACSGILEPSVIIRNYGEQELTSCNIDYQVNGGTLSSYSWSGNLPFLGTDTVSLPAISFEPLESNVLKIFCGNPNNNPDQYPANDTVISTIEKKSTPADVSLLIRTDENPEETTWELTDAMGNVLYSGGPYTTAGAMIMEDFVLNENECYLFNMYDAGGDGFIQPGFFILYYGSNISILQGFGFGNLLSTEFTTDASTGFSDNSLAAGIKVFPNPADELINMVFNLNETGNVKVEIFTLTGEVVYASEIYSQSGLQELQIPCNHISDGMYLLKYSTLQESVTSKVIIRH